MLFVDSSSLVSILAHESDGELFASKLDENPGSVTSSLVIFETVLALRRLRDAPIAEIRTVVEEFLQRALVQCVPIEADQHVGALNAHASFGKGTGHPARLNLGDCFSYSMAKRAGLRLLYKGNDFSHTDLA